MLTKPGVAAAAGVSRLKKTITTGAISELAESRLKPSTGRYKDSGSWSALYEMCSKCHLVYQDPEFFLSPTCTAAITYLL